MDFVKGRDNSKKRYMIPLILFMSKYIVYRVIKKSFLHSSNLKADYYESPISSPNGMYTATRIMYIMVVQQVGINAVVEVRNDKKSNTDARTIYYADAQSSSIHRMER